MMTLVEIDRTTGEDQSTHRGQSNAELDNNWRKAQRLFFAVKQYQWPIWATVLWVSLGIAVASYISVNRAWLLSSNFANDAELILKFARQETDEGGSYRTIANVYAALGLVEKPIAAGLLGVFAAATGAVFALVPSRGLRGVFAPLVLFVFFVLSGAFVGTYTKEIIVVSVVAVICILLSAPSHWSGDFLIFAAVVAVAVVFRPYWIFIALAYIALRVVPLKHLTWWSVPVLLVLGNLVCSFAIYILLGESPDFFRTSVNVHRDSELASTIITRFVDGSAEPWIGALNNLLVMITMVLPLPMLLLGGAYYFLNTGLFMALWGSVLLRLATRQFERPVLAHRLIAILSGFLVAQGLFEPDYGSALRHVTPFIPLILAFWMIDYGDPRELKSDGSDYPVPAKRPDDLQAIEANSSSAGTALALNRGPDFSSEPLALLSLMKVVEMDSGRNALGPGQSFKTQFDEHGSDGAQRFVEVGQRDEEEYKRSLGPVEVDSHDSDNITRAEPVDEGSESVSDSSETSSRSDDATSDSIGGSSLIDLGSESGEERQTNNSSSALSSPTATSHEVYEEPLEVEADIVDVELVESVEVEPVDSPGSSTRALVPVKREMPISGAATTVSNELARAIRAAKANLRPEVRWVASLPALTVEQVEHQSGSQSR